MSLKTKLNQYIQVDEPKRYHVFMINDDYTSWDFCLRIIMSVFNKTLEEADNITNEIHTKGKGLCGTYNFEIAETKAFTVQKQAKKEGFPMKCSVEEA